MNNMGYKVAIALLLIVIGMMWYWNRNTEDALETVQNAPTAEEGYSKALEDMRGTDFGDMFADSYEDRSGEPLTEEQFNDVNAAIRDMIEYYADGARGLY